MIRKTVLVVALALATSAAAPTPVATPAEMRQAENDVPYLVKTLELAPGMTAADVGAGFGAVTIVLSRWLGPRGRVIATDIGAPQLAALREAVVRERLGNVTIVEGAAASANLPDACCDAIFMRDVYHHITDPAAFDATLVPALRPGGRLAIIDFLPEPGSKLQPGVPANRGGHGIPPSVVESEVRAAGLTHVTTIAKWPPAGDKSTFFLVLFRKP